MKKSILFAAALCSMTCLCSCGGSSKGVVSGGDQEVFVPCSGPEYSTNSQFFRATAVGVSTDMNIARKKAMSTARADIASSIESKVKTVVDDYTSSYQQGNADESKRRYQEMTRISVEQSLRGLRTICEKTMRGRDGNYKVYVTLELGGDQLLENMANTIQADDRTMIDFEYSRFKKMFEDEMAK